MQHQIDTYLNHIRAQYSAMGDGTDVRKQMIKEFCESLCTSEGKSYIKVIIGPQRSVHSFIVKEDGPMFKRGDILKAASWAAPAKNFARGTVLDTGSYSNISWTGA
jgi:hypothetical protein